MEAYTNEQLQHAGNKWAQNYYTHDHTNDLYHTVANITNSILSKSIVIYQSNRIICLQKLKLDIIYANKQHSHNV